MPESAEPRAQAHLWWARALAWIESGCATDERRDRLHVWASEPRPNHTDALVRHLLAETTIEELRRSEADRWGQALAIGLRALADGRTREGSRWFRITVEGESIGFSGTAAFHLDRLYERGESLSRVRSTCADRGRSANARVPGPALDS